MKGIFAFVLLTVTPALVFGSTDLDSHCGSLVYVDSFVAATPYYISRASPYYTTCKVHFSRSLSGKIKLTITGSSVDSDVCKVNVFDSLNIVSETGGNLNYYSSFTRSVTSDNSGQLYLHVQGAGCDRYGLSFSVQKVFSADCFEYTCDDGQCVTPYAACDGVDDCADGSDEDGCGFIWTTGAYAGISIGVFFLICFVAVVGVFYRRRRITVVRSPVIIPSGEAVVTQSRW